MATQRTARRKVARPAADNRQVKESIRRLKETYAKAKKSRAELKSSKGTVTLDEQAAKYKTNHDYIAQMSRFADPKRGFTAGELQQLCRWAAAYGRTVGFPFVIRVMTIHDKHERMRFLEKVFRNGTSLREVNALLMQRYGRRGQGGRHPRSLGNLSELLLGIERLTNSWNRLYEFLRADDGTDASRSRQVSWSDLPSNLQEMLLDVVLPMERLRGFVISPIQSTGRPGASRRARG